MIIPFFIPHEGCPHQCVFCNQKNITGQIVPPDVLSFPDTIKHYLRTTGSDARVEIAFFGGTFTALPVEVQKSYLGAAQPFLRSGQVRSIRLSTRPDSLSREILELLREHHVGTVELGVQSMSDEVLSRSGRGHRASDTTGAVSLLREYRFTVGLQLMPGLPGDSPEIFSETVERTIALKPDFVRLYPALVISDTPLEELYRSGRYAALSLDAAVGLCKPAVLAFEYAGIEVIRIGLQPTEELERAGTIIAGPYHPAFRQLVESSIMLDRMRSALMAGKDIPENAIIHVHPRDISNAIGQKRSNIESLKKQFRLNTVIVQPDGALSRRKVRLAAS
jgi:histone acetyltransferase (RNA polymerase elongator complex component)